MKKTIKYIRKRISTRSLNPKTGFFRDGCCKSSVQDKGLHNICVVIKFKIPRVFKNKGNDLVTPRPEFFFPGLKDGDKWCVCVDRWIEAYFNGCAPKIILEATNQSVLSKIEIKILKSLHWI